MEYGELEEGDSIIDTFQFIYDIEDIIDLEMDEEEEEMEYDDQSKGRRSLCGVRPSR